ncbi:MAG: Arginyl-tRNA synthetase, partial [Myxococcaceae bacterium]|nr:Arginyl-tRNA synthetase [Myxococcaceae bacterium]
MRIERYLDGLGRTAISRALGVQSAAGVRATSDAKHGDYQINGVLPLSKSLRQNPRALAESVLKALIDPAHADAAIDHAEVAGPGFINLRLSDAWLASVLGEQLRDLARDGVPESDVREHVVVDFSGPNIAKQMHVGHLRSTIIGAALVRMLRFLGHTVIGDNHIGDWGTQFGLLIVGMRELGDAAALEHEPIVELERVYKLASERAKTDEAFASEARSELAKLQSGDPENTGLWRRFVEITRHELDQVYARLDVQFDSWHGESFYNDMLPGVVELLKERQLVVEDAGALCVFFAELEGAPDELKKQKQPLIVQKSDGAFLYGTTDIATLQYRHDALQANRAIYVVDMRQSLHFKQVFAVARLLGWGSLRMEHLGFGSVLGTDGTPLKTRDGKTITLASLLDEAEERARERLAEAKAEGKVDLDDDELVAVARAVGIGAVKYADLHQNRASDYQFDFDKMITFQGNSGPYLQYAYARIQSIFRKGQVDPDTLQSRLILEAREERA